MLIVEIGMCNRMQVCEWRAEPREVSVKVYKPVLNCINDCSLLQWASSGIKKREKWETRRQRQARRAMLMLTPMRSSVPSCPLCLLFLTHVFIQWLPLLCLLNCAYLLSPFFGLLFGFVCSTDCYFWVYALWLSATTNILDYSLDFDLLLINTAYGLYTSCVWHIILLDILWKSSDITFSYLIWTEQSKTTCEMWL